MPSPLETALADLEFETRTYVPLIRVEVRDHRNLGDMRTQTTTPTLRTYHFDDLEMAAKLAKLLVERLGRPEEAERNMERLSERLAAQVASGNINASVDLGAYGVYLILRNEEVIQSFTYERPTVERVAA